MLYQIGIPYLGEGGFLPNAWERRALSSLTLKVSLLQLLSITN